MIMGKVLAAKFTENTFDETMDSQDSYREHFHCGKGVGVTLGQVNL